MFREIIAGSARALPKRLRLAGSLSLLVSAVCSAQTITPYADAYVRGGTYASNNYGTEAVLAVKASGADYTFRSYLLFDLMSVSGTVTQAKLRLYNGSGVADSHTVNATADAGDNWGESALTDNNVPANGSSLGTLTVGSSAGYYEIDITSRVQAELAGNKILGVALADASSGAAKVEFGSRESANPPQLVLTRIPAVPGTVAATSVSATTIDVTWSDRSDNETNFTVQRYAAGVWSTVATLGAGVTRYTDTGLVSSTTYSYRVRASNANGDSAWSNTSTAATDGVSQTFTSVADTYVGSGTNSAVNYSAETKMGVKLSGANFTFLSFVRFDLSSVSAPVTGAKLRLYAETAEAETHTVSAVASDTWSESTLTYATMPTIGSQVATLATGASPGYYEVDLTAHVQSEMAGNKKISLALQDTTTGGTRVDYQTKEGANPPRLILNLAISAPSAPTGVAATATSSESIEVTWTDPNATEDSYVIEAKQGAGGTFTTVGTVAANATSFVHNELLPATTYYYRVKAVNLAGNSAWSSEVSATTLPTPPNAPTALSATTISSSRIDLAWTDNATNETSYFVERRQDGSATWTEIAALGANAVSYSSTGLAAGTTYHFRVVAANTGGDSGYSNVATATTSQPTGPQTIPVDADSYVGSGVNAASNFDGATVLRVKKSGVDFTYLTYLRFDLRNVTGTVTAATLRVYAQSTVSQTHDVKAVADSGDGWNETTLTFNNAPAPGAVKATISTGTTAGYKTADLTSHVQAELAGNKLVTLVIEDQSSGAELVEYQSKDGANPPQLVLTIGSGTVPIVPTGLVAGAASSTQINLSWTDVANETGYKLERKTGAGGTWSQIATPAANVTTYNNTGLTANTTYYYRIRAYNSAGDSAYSSESVATTLAATPQNCLQQGYRPAPLFPFDNTIVWRPIRTGATYTTTNQGWRSDVKSVGLSKYYVFGPQMIRLDPASPDASRRLVVDWNGVGSGAATFPRSFDIYLSQMPPLKPAAWDNGTQVYQPTVNTPDAAFTFMLPNGEDVETFVEFTWPLIVRSSTNMIFDWDNGDRGRAAARNGYPSTESGYKFVRNIVYGTGFPYDQNGNNVGRVSGSASSASNMAGALVWEELDPAGTWRQFWEQKTGASHKYIRHILHATASHNILQDGAGNQANTYSAPATSSDSGWTNYSHPQGIRYGRLYALQFADEAAFDSYCAGFTPDEKAVAWGLWRFGIRFFDGRGSSDGVVTIRANGMQVDRIKPEWFDGVSNKLLQMVKDLKWVDNAANINGSSTYWTGPGAFPSVDSLWPALTPIPQFNFNPVP